MEKTTKEKVFLGMSGGVDSSAAAVILLEQGYDVEGVTMLLCPNANADSSFVADARAVCEQLSIPLHVVDFKNEFQKGVISPFVKEYTEGRTPNPCIICNPHIKFGLLLDYALENGADYIATGHYALIEKDKQGGYLLKKSPSRKDQSYFLCRLNQRQLAHTLFPLGAMNKDDVRAMAKKAGLPVASKGDSQEICFIPDDDYAAYIEENFNYKAESGDFTNENGDILGRHKGIIHYTVGQRKGLGAAFGQPMYVKKIDTAENTVVLCEAENRFSGALEARNVNWISGTPKAGRFFAQVKVRNTARAANAEIFADGDKVKIIFSEPQICVSPGQSAVIYDGDILLAGGFIL